MSQYLDKDGASRIAENFLSKQAEQDAILTNLQFDLKEAEHALVKTIQGPAPLSIRALTRPLDDYLISGNTVQYGTPTPSDPVDVVGCGVGTGQLALSYNATGYVTVYSAALFADFDIKPNTEYTLSFDALQGAELYTNENIFTSSMRIVTDGSRCYVTRTTKSSIPASQYISGSGWLLLKNALTLQSDPQIANIMLNTGSAALPYEPYGYKLPLTVNSTEYPIYLGNVPTTRRIKKLVLTGDEYWDTGTVGANRFFYYYRSDAAPTYTVIRSTHYIPSNVPGAQRPNNSIRQTAASINIRDDACATIYDFKSYLAAQYSDGTPVTVWYILADPETGIVNEPLHKIDDYADTISMTQANITLTTTKGFNTITTGTTVLPSNIEVKGVINNA